MTITRPLTSSDRGAAAGTLGRISKKKVKERADQLGLHGAARRSCIRNRAPKK